MDSAFQERGIQASQASLSGKMWLLAGQMGGLAECGMPREDRIVVLDVLMVISGSRLGSGNLLSIEDLVSCACWVLNGRM